MTTLKQDNKIIIIIKSIKQPFFSYQFHQVNREEFLLPGLSSGDGPENHIYISFIHQGEITTVTRDRSKATAKLRPFTGAKRSSSYLYKQNHAAVLSFMTYNLPFGEW